MARMPPAPVAESSCSEKPTTWSISSWDRMRSAPARSVESSPAPSSIMVAHSAASDASPPSAPPAALTCPELCSARAAAQSSSRAWSSMSATALALLNDDFLEEHRVDFRRVDGDVDAAQQLLAQAVDAGGAVEVARPQLAHEDLKSVLDAGQERLNVRDGLRVLELEGGAELEDLGPLLVRLVREIDHHLANLEEGDRLRGLVRLGHVFLLVQEEVVAASAKAAEKSETERAEHQQLLLGAAGLCASAILRRGWRVIRLFGLLRFFGHAAAPQDRARTPPCLSSFDTG